MDHTACAYVAMDKGWFTDAGLTIHAYEPYETGMASWLIRAGTVKDPEIQREPDI